MSRILTQRLAILVAAAWLVLTPARAEAQKALVYCPVGIDAAGCNTIVAALTTSALFPDGVDAGWDGTSGTVDLAGGDLSGYAVFVVPSLADGANVQPYALLRNATIAGRLQSAFMGRAAVWSGTPDVGSTNRATKDQLIRNLAAWAKADSAGTHGPGVVALQDNSDDGAGRYTWLSTISGISVTADTTLNVYSNVQALTQAATTILAGSGGLQIGYTNMASFALVPGTAVNSDATGGRSSAVVLATVAGEPSDPNLATVSTDKDDYFPPDTVTITGAGWEPGETVDLLFHEDLDPPIHPDATGTTVADGTGHIFSHSFEIDSADIGVRFILTATGQTSGRTAQTTFTDATGLNSVTMLGTQTPSPITPGASATYGTVATNSVQVRFNGNGSCTVTMTASGLPSGATATFAPITLTGTSTGNLFTLLTVNTTAATPTGTSTVTVRATGTGGGGNDCSTSTTQTTTTTLVVKRPSSTAVSGPASSVFGSSVTFTATVSGSGPTPTGTVQFKDGGTNVGALQTLSGGAASINTSALTTGAHTITAVYSGDANYDVSTSPNFGHTVNPANTTTALSSSSSPSTFGQSITFTASVTALAPGGGTPGGTVQFKIDGSNFGAPVTLNASGVATSGATSTLTVGSHPVAAVYSGNTNYAGSTSTVIATQTVNQATSTTTLASSANPSVFGQSVTLTATVKNGATPITVGNIAFIEGGTCASPGTTLQANQSPNGSGVVTYTSAALSVAGHSVLACYDGSGAFGPSQAALTQTVNKAATSTTISSDTPDPSTVGQAVTVNYAVAVTTPGAGTPSGNVTVTDGIDSCVGTAAAGTCSITLNTAGARTLTATYAGDGSFNTSASAGAAHTVNLITTTTAVTSSLNPSSFGTSVTFTATVTSGVNPVTVGSVTLIEGGTCAAPTTTLQAAQAVNGSGQVTFATTALTVGTHTIVGCYGVSGSFAASNGNVVQTVNVAPTTLTVASATGTFGGTTALSATLTRTGDGPISGKTVTFTLNGSPAGSATTNASGVASIAAASLSGINAGSYPTGVGASFAGDASFALSGGTGALTVNQGTVTVTVTVIPTSIAYGALVELDADLSPSLSGKTISFSIDGTPVGTDVTNGAGKAKLMNVNPATAGIAAGSHTVTATFPPETNFATASGTGSLTITQATTTAAVTSSLNPSAFGQAVTFTATVTSAGGTPSGSATFIEGGTCAAPTTTLQAATALDGAGKATFSSSTLTAGSHTIVACFLGSANFGASSGNVAQTVNKGTPAVTWTNPADISYGTALSATQLNATASVPGSFVYTPAAGTVLPAGNGQTLSVSFTPTDATNYNSVPSTTVTINVLKLSLTPHVTANNKPYDGTTAATVATRSLTGVFGTDDVTLTGGTATFNTKQAGTAKTVTVTGLSLGGTSAGNYLLSSTTATATADIEPRALAVTATGQNKEYDGNATATVTLADDRISGDVFTASYTLATFADANVGTAKTITVSGISLSGTDAVNYTPNTSTTTAADITGRALAVKADAKTKMYGDPDPAFTYQLTSGTLVSGDGFSGALSRAAGESVSGGPYAITQGTLTAGPNYSIAFTGADLTITPRPVTLTADAGQTKVYGDADPVFTYQVTSGSLASGDNFTGALSRTAGEHVADSPFSITQGTLSLGDNYTLAFTGAGFAITPRPVTATADTKTKVYGNADPALTYQLTSGSLAFSDAFSGALTRAPGEAVGSFAITQGTLALSSDYTLAFVGANLSITARPVTVTADAKTKVYGEADPALTYQLTAGTLVGSDAFSGALTRAAGESAGTHAIEQGTLALSANYALTFIGADLTITPRPVEVTADAKTKVYGDADPALTYQITSGTLAFSDAFSGALSRNAGEHVSGSPYAITQGTLTLGTNYDLSFVGADLAVTARPVTVTAEAKSKVYGDPEPALTYQITSGSLASGDGFTGALTRAAGETVATSPYAISQGTLALTDDYTLSFVGAALTITQRPVTVTADVKTKVYGDTDPALTYQITSGSLAFSDGFSGALTRTVGETVGGSPYAILQGSLALNPNYALTYLSADLTITSRPVEVTADAKTKVYGDPDPALTYQLTGGNLIGGDSFSGALSRAAGEDVGSRAILQGTLTLGGNYTITFVGADLTISLRPVTVTADAKTKVYGDADPALTYQITSGSLAFSDGFSGALSRVAGEDVGTRAIQQGSLSLGPNYTLSFIDASLTITSRPVTVTADAGQGKVYGNPEPALAYHITSGSLAFSDAFSGALSRLAGEGVGSYAIQQGTLALSANYTLGFVGANFAISQRPVTVTAQAKTRVYGNPDPALTYLITTGSLAFSDAFSGSLVRAAGETVLGGPYAITQGTLALSSNYALTYIGANLSITARPMTATAEAKSKTYGTSDPVLTYQITLGTLVAGDAFSGTIIRAPGENVGGYAITQGTLALSTNYALTFIGASFTIGTRPVTVTADAKNKFFGAGDPPLTYQLTSGTLVAGDAFSGALTRTAGEATGTYPILQGSLSLGGNYAMTYVGASLVIKTWTLAGYYQPVDMPTGGMVWNTVKGGSTVPLKFQVFVGSLERTDVGAVKAFTATPTSCGTPGVDDLVEITTTGGTELRYTGGQFIQNWQTPKSAGSCYRTTMTAQDGSLLTAYFKLK